MTSNNEEESSPKPKRRPSFTLRKKHLDTQSGGEFKALLLRVAADGKVTEDECKELSSWLNTHYSSEIPAVRFLIDEINSAEENPLTDGDKMRYLLTCILRVLPKKDRDEIVAQESEPAWKSDSATPAQLSYIQRLGGELPPGSTKGEASALIDSLLTDGHTPVAPATNRQRMLLRFWNNEELASEGKWAVSEWIDVWNSEDPSRVDAWLAWKTENADDDTQDDPDNVPVGAGFGYIENKDSATGVTKSESTKWNGCATCAVIVVVVFLSTLILASCLAKGR